MEFEKVTCPKCGKRLMDAEKSSCGRFYLYCKGCRRTYLISLGGAKCTAENR